jgi:PAS domain S-box-containing protein
MGLDYRSVLYGFADAVVAADERGKIVFANPAAERLLGWEDGGLVGQPLVAIQPERLREAHRSGFQRYLDTRVPQLLGRPVRLPALRRDGSEVDVELVISAHRLDGQGELFVAALRDLRDRVELERQLAVGRYLKAANRAAARLTANLDVSHVVSTAVEVLVADFDAALARIWLHRPDEGILELVASAGLSTATSTSRRARIDLATYPYKVGEVARGRCPFVQNGLEGDPQFEQDWVVREGIAAAALYPLVVADELLGVVATFMRHPLHDEVTGALATLAALVATALDDTRQLAAARAAQAATDTALGRAALLAEAGILLAASLDEQALTRITELLVPRVADLCRVDMLDEDGVPALFAAATADPALARAHAEMERRYPIAGRPDSGQTRVIRSGEPELVEELSAQVIAPRVVDAGQRELVDQMRLTSYLCVPLVARGQVLGALTCVDTAVSGRHLGRDDLSLVSELASTAALAVANARLYRQAQTANRALERSNADLEQFAYTASHDLREPLRAVAGYAQLLKARYGDRLDQNANEYMTFMVDGARRLQALTDDLLTYSRVGNEPLTRAPVDLAQLAEQVLELLAAPIAERGAKVDVGPLPTVQGGEAQLQRVLQNLVANALKFTEPGQPAQVELSASQEQGAWRISVADRGIGIDPSRAEQAFQMFQRLHSRQDYPGSGIGLSLCRRIVERHGGRIWFEPRPDGGTVFLFTIPDRPDSDKPG